MHDAAAIKNHSLSKGRGKKAVANRKAKDRTAFDRALSQSLRELNEGKVFEIDRKDPEKSIRRILKTAK
jgi:hypothetical protein